MNIDVRFAPQAVTEDDIEGRIVVVLDVLRACSTIVTALYNGARAVIPVGDMAEGARIAAHLDPDNSLMGGERGAKMIDGYGAGNSPLEYNHESVAGKFVVLNTTNGTGTFVRARSAAETIAGCFLNVDRVVDYLKNLGNESETSVLMLCAGHYGGTALEDVLCAGMILDKLWGDQRPDTLSDGAHIAYSQFRYDRKRLARALFGCEHTQRLIELGFGDDVAYCAQLNTIPILPRYEDSRLVLDVADRAVSDDFLRSLADPTDELTDAIAA